MAVAIVGSARASTAAAGTLQPRLQRVAANDTLLSFVIQAGGQMPPLPTDTSGDAFELIDQNVHGNGSVAFTLAYALRSAGGNQTLSVSTLGASQMVAADLSGVATPVLGVNAGGHPIWNPAIPDGICDVQAQGVTNPTGTLYASSATGGLAFALLCVAGSPTITCNSPSWAAAFSGSATNLSMSYDLRTLSYAGPTTADISWTLSAPADVIVLVVGMPAA